MDDERPHNYAILIGVNDDRMQACVQDVTIMREVLREISSPIDLRILIEPTCSFPEAASLIERSQMRPTPKNVKSTLKSITDEAVKGDFVYIHFSGHGKEVVMNGSCGGDVDLALLQEKSDEHVMLSGENLAFLSKAMVEKGLTVLLVLDCCFSGASLRGAAGSKANIDGRDGERYWQAPPRSRDATMLPNWIVNPAGFTILTACGPHESAATLGLPSQQAPYSAFTYSLYESLIGQDATSKTLYEVYENLCLRFKRIPALAAQTPMLYGNGKIRFFGRPVEGNDGTPRAAAYWPSGGYGKIWLQAGEVHGFCVNDEFIVTPYYGGGAACKALARAVTVGPLTSELEIFNSLGTRGDETRWTATSTTRLALQRFPVEISEECPELDQWRASIAKQASLDIRIADNHDKSIAFSVNPNGKGGIDILDSTRKPVPRLPVTNAKNVEDNLHIIEHLVRFKHAEELTNTRYSSSVFGSQECFEVEFRRGSESFGPSEIIPMRHEEEGVIRIKNHSNSTLYAQFLDLGPRWQVKHIASGMGDVIPPVGYAGGLKERNVCMTLPDDQGTEGLNPYCDILKVFISTSPINLSSWELPDIGRARVPAALKDENYRTDFRGENWAAMNFYIRTER